MSRSKTGGSARTLRKPIWDSPPISLFFFWTLVTYACYDLESLDFLVPQLCVFSESLLLATTFVSTLFYLYGRVRRFCRRKRIPFLEPPPLSSICKITAFAHILYECGLLGVLITWICFFVKWSFFFYNLWIVIRYCYRKIRKFFQPQLVPQMGYSEIDPYLKEALQIWFLFESLRDARTKRGMSAAIAQYMQAHVKPSLPMYFYNKITSRPTVDWTGDDGFDQVEEMLNEAFGANGVEERDDGLFILDPHSGPIEWHLMFDAAFSNWQQMRNSALSKKFFHLINVLVAAGMCETANLTFKIGDVSLFSPIVSKKQANASDVFEAFYEATAGFMKGGWRVFKTHTVSAFFVEDDKINEFEDLYNQIRSWHGYALAGNLLQYTEIDDNEYENKINAAITFGETLLKTIKRSQRFEYKYVSDRLDHLRVSLVEFIQLRTRGGLRLAPFAVCLFGRSGCGKSSLTNLTLNAGLIFNKLSAAKDRIATWADNSKFADTIRSHINGIIFDDFANTKEEFMDFSPAYRLIQVINNIKYLAPMADVFLKGKVSLNPYFCMISTNVEHLNAAKYSNEPESVLRRMYHVLVVPKEEFLDDDGILSSAKIRKVFGETPTPDAWYLTIRKYHAQDQKHVDLSLMIPIVWRGREMKDINIYDYLEWVQEASKEHFEAQGRYLANQEKIPEPCPKCGLCYCNPERCGNPMDQPQEWTEDDDENFARAELENEANAYLREVMEANEESDLDDDDEPPPLMAVPNGRTTPPIRIPLEPESGEISSYFHAKAQRIQLAVSYAKTSATISAHSLCQMWERFDWLPERYVCHPTVLKVGLIFWREELKQSLISGISFLTLILLFLCLSLPSLSVLWVVSFPLCVYFYVCATIQTFRYMVRSRVLELKDVVKTYTQSWQLKYAIIGLGTIGVILAVMRSKYANLQVQTGLNPQNIQEVNERNDRVNPWLGVTPVPLPMSEPSRTTTSTDLAAAMRTNIVGIVSEENKTTLGFYITSNFVLVPTHYVSLHSNEDISIRCYKNGEGRVGSFFRDKISKSFSVQIPQTDFTLCFLTSGGSMKDFRKFLPTAAKMGQVAAKVITRDILESELRSLPTLFRGTTTVTHTISSFVGGYYTLQEETKCGMCMSPVISDGHGSTIIGFHLGGKGNVGGCGTLTLDQVNFAIQELASKDGVVLSASNGILQPEMGDFPTSAFGQPILFGTEIHEKSAVNFLSEGANVDVYGTTSGKATPRSNVTPTMMSDTIAEVFGVPQKWGPPKMKGKGRYPFQATLAHAALPCLPFGSVLSKAVSCYKSIAIGLKERLPELFKAKPLSRVATVSGLKGVKFIDPMNFNTSPGFPLSGSKHPYLEELDPEEYPECGKPRTFTKEIWDEFDEVVSILRSGKRCYMIWKSCLKDEATKLTKDKVRVFQSAPLVLQLLVRMYFLPIVRIIQMNPILFECAVGVNAEGLEWDELWEAAMKKGRERVLAGDYSKYDVRMSAQLTIAAFDILIDIAALCDYSQEDLDLMRNMVHEVVYPVMAYNGDLIQLFGTNPSGQNLTVIINSIVNSLLLRSCFYTIYPDLNFKDHCAFLTYGDDVIGTVSAFCELFTHITYAEFLAKHDIKFTMPDKESIATHYMSESDVDFLKRKCVFNADLGQKVGLLSEDSIFKRLHTHVLSKDLTMAMHSAQNIESSAHDWFYYGREVFEVRQAQLKQVAEKCEISHLCPSLDISYDKRVQQWRAKYLNEEMSEDDPEAFILEPNCGDLYVSTVDYLDHCIGTASEPLFKWEITAASYTMACYSFIWQKIFQGARFKIGMPSFGWILFLTLTTGGFQNGGAILRLVVSTFVWTYVPPYLMYLIALAGLHLYSWCDQKYHRWQFRRACSYPSAA